MTDVQIIDPDTYIESRRTAIVDYLRDYNLSYEDVGCKPWILNSIVMRKSISMKNVDLAYNLLVEKTGEVKPVKGEPIDEWKRNMIKEYEKIREEECILEYELATYMGMNISSYKRLKKDPSKAWGKALWDKLLLLRFEDEPEDLYKPKYTSIRQLWQGVS